MRGAEIGTRRRVSIGVDWSSNSRAVGHEIENRGLRAADRQVRSTKLQFLDLVNCPMTREPYEGTLVEGDHL